MIARTHDLAAFTALSLIFVIMPTALLSLSTVLLATLFNLIGGILPDIDQPAAPLWKNLPIGKYIGRAFDTVAGGHRFLTHSLIGVAGFSYLIYLLLHVLQPIFPTAQLSLVWWAFVIGILSHLVMDSFTKEGVPWLLPITTKFGFPPLKRFRITTGQWVETWIIFPLLCLVLIELYAHQYPFFLAFFHHLTH